MQPPLAEIIAGRPADVLKAEGVPDWARPDARLAALDGNAVDLTPLMTDMPEHWTRDLAVEVSRSEGSQELFDALSSVAYEIFADALRLASYKTLSYDAVEPGLVDWVATVPGGLDTPSFLRLRAERREKWDPFWQVTVTDMERIMLAPERVLALAPWDRLPPVSDTPVSQAALIRGVGEIQHFHVVARLVETISAQYPHMSQSAAQVLRALSYDGAFVAVRADHELVGGEVTTLAGLSHPGHLRMLCERARPALVVSSIASSCLSRPSWRSRWAEPLLRRTHAGILLDTSRREWIGALADGDHQGRFMRFTASHEDRPDLAGAFIALESHPAPVYTLGTDRAVLALIAALLSLTSVTLEVDEYDEADPVIQALLGNLFQERWIDTARSGLIHLGASSIGAETDCMCRQSWRPYFAIAGCCG